jgi:drug/metabolite transporter (DMT)-like permease
MTGAPYCSDWRRCSAGPPWATAFKISLRYLRAEQLLLVASSVSTVALLVIMVVRGRAVELLNGGRHHWRRSLLLGALNPFAYYLVLFEAYRRLPAQEGQAINYTWAITMSLLAAPLSPAQYRQRFRKV